MNSIAQREQSPVAGQAIDPTTDPFLRKWLASGTALTASGWTAEAYRRLVHWKRPEHFPYYPDEQTWYWSREMLEETLSAGGDTTGCTFDPSGPGVGVHVFETMWTPVTLAKVYTDVRMSRGLLALRKNGPEVTNLNHPVVCFGDEACPIYLLRVTEQGCTTGVVHRGIGSGEVDREAAMDCRYHDHHIFGEIASRLQGVLRSKAMVYEPQRAPRHFRRQAKRELGVDMDTLIRVVNWRKERRGGDGDSDPSGRSVGFHQCRGHFRAQAYGPGRKLRKAIYIEAHWKGSGPVKSTAPVVNMVRH